MKTTVTVILAIALCVATEPGAAQQKQTTPQRVEAFLSHVPMWPATGVLPPEFADKFFVYFDLATQEYVVSYPERLKTGRPDDGRRITFRFEPQFVVEPEISLTISKAADGGFIYDYVLRNGPTAKRPIRWFALVATSTDDSLVWDHPRWGVHGAVAPTPHVAPQAGLLQGPELRLRANMGKFVGWWNDDEAAPLAPGVALGGFRVRSTFRPGITTAYCATGTALRVPSELPIEVSDQITPLLLVERNSKVSLTIGPKFDPKAAPTADPVWIAADYRLGIQRLTLEGRLSSESAFIKEVDSLLSAVVLSGQKARLEFRSKPDTALEQEIASALSFALNPQ